MNRMGMSSIKDHNQRTVSSLTIINFLINWFFKLFLPFSHLHFELIIPVNLNLFNCRFATYLKADAVHICGKFMTLSTVGKIG